MAIVEIISDWYNPRNPKCRNCHYYGKQVHGEVTNELSADCRNEYAKIKHRNRYHNSKACSHFKRV